MIFLRKTHARTLSYFLVSRFLRIVYKRVFTNLEDMNIFNFRKIPDEFQIEFVKNDMCIASVSKLFDLNGGFLHENYLYYATCQKVLKYLVGAPDCLAEALETGHDTRFPLKGTARRVPPQVQLFSIKRTQTRCRSNVRVTDQWTCLS